MTVRLFRIERRIILRPRSGSDVFNTLSKGSIRGAIWRATCGITPRGMNSGNASPNRCEEAAVASNADWSCRFLDGWKPTRIPPPLPPHAEMPLSATAISRSANHGASAVLSLPPGVFRLVKVFAVGWCVVSDGMMQGLFVFGRRD